MSFLLNPGIGPFSGGKDSQTWLHPTIFARVLSLDCLVAELLYVRVFLEHYFLLRGGGAFEPDLVFRILRVAPAVWRRSTSGGGTIFSFFAPTTLLICLRPSLQSRSPICHRGRHGRRRFSCTSSPNHRENPKSSALLRVTNRRISSLSYSFGSRSETIQVTWSK